MRPHRAGATLRRPGDHRGASVKGWKGNRIRQDRPANTTGDRVRRRQRGAPDPGDDQDGESAAAKADRSAGGDCGEPAPPGERSEYSHRTGPRTARAAGAGEARSRPPTTPPDASFPTPTRGPESLPPASPPVDPTGGAAGRRNRRPRRPTAPRGPETPGTERAAARLRPAGPPTRPSPPAARVRRRTAAPPIAAPIFALDTRKRASVN